MKFRCKVITRSSRNEILGLDNLNKLDLGFKDNNESNLPFLKIYLTAAPVNGRANKELIKLLSETLGVGKSRVNIIKGERSNEKIIQIDE